MLRGIWCKGSLILIPCWNRQVGLTVAQPGTRGSIPLTPDNAGVTWQGLLRFRWHKSKHLKGRLGCPGQGGRSSLNSRSWLHHHAFLGWSIPGLPSPCPPKPPCRRSRRILTHPQQCLHGLAYVLALTQPTQKSVQTCLAANLQHLEVAWGTWPGWEFSVACALRITNIPDTGAASDR